MSLVLDCPLDREVYGFRDAVFPAGFPDVGTEFDLLRTPMICCSLNFDFFIAELLYEKKLYFYLVRLSEEASLRQRQ
jgi:hypothetical protein